MSGGITFGSYTLNTSSITMTVGGGVPYCFSLIGEQSPALVLGYDPKPGVVSFRTDIYGETIDISDGGEALEDLRDEVALAEADLTNARLNLALHCKLTFIRDHELTAAEFDDPVNRMLFAITYPEAR